MGGSWLETRRQGEEPYDVDLTCFHGPLSITLAAGAVLSSKARLVMKATTPCSGASSLPLDQSASGAIDRALQAAGPLADTEEMEHVGGWTEGLRSRAAAIDCSACKSKEACRKDDTADDAVDSPTTCRSRSFTVETPWRRPERIRVTLKLFNLFPCALIKTSMAR